MPPDRDRFRRAIGLILPLALGGALLSPAIGTGYLADDVISSLLPGMIRFTGSNLLERTLGAIRSSIELGRFYPLVWIEYNAVFWLVRDVVAYKCLIVLGCLANLALLMALVRRIGGDWRLASLAAVATTVLFQFRTFFDPILSFHGLLQLVTGLLLGSLLALVSYLDGRGRRWLVASSAMYLTCLLLYEVTYPLFLLHAALIAARRPGWLERARALMPFVAPAVACAGASVLVRKLYPGESYIHALNLAPAAVAMALAKQTSAALPLSAFLADPAGLFVGVRGPLAMARWLARGDALAVAVLGALAASVGLRGGTARPGGIDGAWSRWTLASLGVLLGVLPGVMIAISGRYQGEIGFGTGYLPVYMQCFGVGLLLATGLRVLSERPGRTRWAVAVVAATIGLTSGLTYRANSLVATSLNAPPGTSHFNPVAAGMWGESHYQRINLEAAIRAGLMEDVPDGSRLQLANIYANWHEPPLSTFFYLMHSGRDALVTEPRSAEHAPGSGDSYVVKDVCLGRAAGFVLLWREGSGGERSGPVRLFVRHPKLHRHQDAPAFAIIAPMIGEGGPPRVRPVDEGQVVRSGAGWALCEFDDRVDPDNVRVTFDQRTIAEAVAARSPGPGAVGPGTRR